MKAQLTSPMPVQPLNQAAYAHGNSLAPSPKSVREEHAYTLGTSAFLWGFTMNELYRVRSNSLAKPGAAVNKFDHNRTLLTPEEAHAINVVRANNATLYSIAWLDLSVEPIVLEFPAIPDRYFTFNYVDYYQRNENISNATVGRAGGAYAFAGPNWRGALPEQVHRVNVATDTLWMIGRLEVKGPDDLKDVVALQDRCSLTSLKEWVGGRRNTSGSNVYPEWPPYDASNPLNFFVVLNEGLKRNPPYGQDLAVLGMFESLNIGPNKSFDPAKLEPATAAGLRRAIEIGPNILAADHNARMGVVKNEWHITTDLGSWVTPDTGQLDFLLRSDIAKEAQPGQNASEAIYALTYTDAEGEPLTSANRYILRFPKGHLPPVNAFWSVTMYDETGFMIANPIHRSQLGTYDNLKPESDGSVVIYIQRENPGQDKEANWLPAAEGPFNVALRMYNAGPAVLTLDWVPPAVEGV